MALSQFSSDFSHLLVHCDLHRVQLLLMKINCTSKLAIKIPILFYSGLLPYNFVRLQSAVKVAQNV